jgi:pSer/pThr/pTyr-binding forkhead associated (FHA) protein
MPDEQKMPSMPAADSSLTATTDLREAAEEAQRVLQNQRQKPLTESESIFNPEMKLHIQVDGFSLPIVVAPHPKTTIGRKDPTSGDSPDIDLSTYAAYQMGVSRTHAILELAEDHLTLHDLGSRNGTFINGQRVTPEHPQLLHNGDEVRLGKMVLRLSFRREN